MAIAHASRKALPSNPTADSNFTRSVLVSLSALWNFERVCNLSALADMTGDWAFGMAFKA
jgi:hypothetical protein